VFDNRVQDPFDVNVYLKRPTTKKEDNLINATTSGNLMGIFWSFQKRLHNTKFLKIEKKIFNPDPLEFSKVAVRSGSLAN